MKSIQPVMQDHSIVLIGDFNPKIFQPAWFSSEELILAGEADAATIEIIHPEVVIFSLEWLRLEVTRERFSASTALEAYDEIVRDLVIGAFNILRHTPLRQMGINRNMLFQMKSEDQWHSVGHGLAPKEPWNDILDSPGMVSLVMQGNQDRDGRKGHTRVTVQPSAKVENGVYVKVNDHFEVKDQKSGIGSDEIIDTLNSFWKKSYTRSKKIIYSILERFTCT